MSNFVPRRSLPPLNAVRAFEAVARLGSMKEAAVELSVTHGAVSQQIRLLEEWLGAPALFRRSTPASHSDSSGRGPAGRIRTGARSYFPAAVQQHRSRGHDAPSIVLSVNALATFSLALAVATLWAPFVRSIPTSRCV